MDDIELLLASRQLVYSVLARAYAEEPDEAMLDAIMDEQLDTARAIVSDGSDGERSQDELSDIRQHIVSAGGDGLSACVPDLRAQYVRIIVGPGTLHAAPWESRHTSHDRFHSRSAVLAVRDAYRRAGLLPERYRHVSDDFIGLEFDFMAKLARFALASYQAGDMPQCIDWLHQSERFLREHLLTWIGSLADAMQKHYGD